MSLTVTPSIGCDICGKRFKSNVNHAEKAGWEFRNLSIHRQVTLCPKCKKKKRHEILKCLGLSEEEIRDDP